MYTVCYRTPDGAKDFVETDDLKSFKQQNPAASIVAVFFNDNNIQKNAEEFARYAPYYGLSPDDFLRPMHYYAGEECVICGVKPQNRKYPIIILNTATNISYKITARLARIRLGYERP